MPLTATTSLSQALRADPDLAGRLTARLGPDNALSRLLADGDVPPGRIHLADAAAIAGRSVQELLDLAGAPASTPAPAAAPAPAPANDWFAQAERAGVTVMDVRPMLAEGRDPFAAVIQSAGAVEPGGFLLLDAPFDPAPLRRVLAGKGLMSQGRPIGEKHWRICFRREGGTPDESVFDLPATRKPGEIWRENGVPHVETRGMTPPGPMTAVLRLIDGGEMESIVSHHERDPLLLYPELEERGWECTRKESACGEVRLHLRRIPA